MIAILDFLIGMCANKYVFLSRELIQTSYFALNYKFESNFLSMSNVYLSFGYFFVMTVKLVLMKFGN